MIIAERIVAPEIFPMHFINANERGDYLIFSNIIGYDGIIVMLTLVNIAIIVLYIRNISLKVQKQLIKVVYLPITDLMEKINPNGKKESLDLNDLMNLHQRSEKLYQMFLAVTSILPLLGILGTVIALLNTANADIEILKASFTFALKIGRAHV